ncbi:MAG: hypothetical protein K0R38_1021 [Polyangiaceae bacterium]|jgi:hypothetical protein|nr:hypothetical protein [Polyangiaceae bacterium]
MPFHLSGLGFSANIPHAAQRYCYVRATALEQLLAAPGSLELLLRELTGEPPQSTSVVEQLAQLKRRAIHLSVTRSAYQSLSLEEIVVLCAYTSPHFEHSAFRHQLLAEPSAAELSERCKAWLRERATRISGAEELGARCWPLVGHSPPSPAPTAPGQAPLPPSPVPAWPTPRSSPPSASASLTVRPSSAPPSSLRHSSFTVAVAPMPHSGVLDRDLPALGAESGFAHEHYIACAPAVALDYVRRAATLGGTLRWDPFALDRRLRSLGIGLLLVEGGNVNVYLPARYHSSPLRAPSGPPQSGAFKG